MMLMLKRGLQLFLLFLITCSMQVTYAAPRSWYNDETIFTPNAYVKFLNADKTHTIQLQLTLQPQLYLSCNGNAGAIIKSVDSTKHTYLLTIPPSNTTTSISPNTSTNDFCYFHYKIGHAMRHYWLISGTGPIKLEALYQGSIVARGQLYFGVFQPATRLSYKPLQSDLSYGSSICRGGVSSQFPVFWINSPLKKICSGSCHAAAIDSTSEIAGVYTVQMTQRNLLMPKGKQCDKNKTPFTIGPTYGVIKITPTGFTQIDADTSYVEVLNQTSTPLHWGYTDLYNYFATAGKTFDSFTPTEQRAAYQSVAPGQSSYINVHKTDTFSLGIQAGPNLLTLYKHKDADNPPAQCKVCSECSNNKAFMGNACNVCQTSTCMNIVGRYYWSVMTAKLMATTKVGTQSTGGFANLPEMLDTNGRPIAVCTNVNPKQPIDLIDGKTLLITVYDPTQYTKPSSCYSADVSQGFNASGYNSGGV